MAWTLSHPHPGSNLGPSYIKSCGLQLGSPQPPLFLPPHEVSPRRAKLHLTLPSRSQFYLTTPSPTQLLPPSASASAWKNCLQGNRSLMPKRLGTAAFVGILFFLSLSILFCIVGMIKVGWVWRINDAASPKYDLISHSLLSYRVETTGLVSPMKRERTRCPDPRERMCWNSVSGLWLPSLLPALPKTRSAPLGRTRSQTIK